MDDISKAAAWIDINNKLNYYFRAHYKRCYFIEYTQASIAETPEEGPVLRIPCYDEDYDGDEEIDYYRDIPLSLLALPLSEIRVILEAECNAYRQKQAEERKARQEAAKRKAAAKKARQALQKEEEERLKLKELLEKYGSPQ